MRTFNESLTASFKKTDKGYWSFKFGEDYELAIEPLLFDNQFYLALYKNEGLLLKEKVVIRPGYIKSDAQSKT